MTSEPFWLETDRLALRRFVPSDLEWLFALYSDAEVARFVGGTKTHAQAEDFLRTRILDYYDAHPGLGIWMTVERSTSDRIGLHLLNHIQGESIIQVGFVLARSSWGRGFATEMGAALVRQAFVDLRLPRLAGIAHRENTASHRVLEKIGLRRHGERTLSHPAYAAQGPLAWFERDAADWPAQSIYKRPSRAAGR